MIFQDVTFVAEKEAVDFASVFHTEKFTFADVILIFFVCQFTLSFLCLYVCLPDSVSVSSFPLFLEIYFVSFSVLIFLECVHLVSTAGVVLISIHYTHVNGGSANVRESIIPNS